MYEVIEMEAKYQTQFDRFCTIENVPVTYYHPLMNAMDQWLTSWTPRTHSPVTVHAFVRALEMRWRMIKERGMLGTPYFFDYMSYDINSGCNFTYADVSEYTGAIDWTIVSNGNVEVV